MRVNPNQVLAMPPPMIYGCAIIDLSASGIR
jgi:hypothetical protein